jgi:hypothetical protein
MSHGGYTDKAAEVANILERGDVRGQALLFLNYDALTSDYNLARGWATVLANAIQNLNPPASATPTGRQSRKAGS